MTKYTIHLSVPHMSGGEQAFVQDAFATNWLSTVGPNINAFEAEMSTLLEDRPTLAVASGTAALHLALRAAGVGPGDRVALSTLTFAGSLYPILYQGAIPVLIDSERTSWNIDPALVAQYFRDSATTNTLPKALVVVHLYGQHADLEPLRKSCDEYGVSLIEDSAESLGATYRGRQTATIGDHAILSFNGNKIITTTGGGMVVTHDPAALARMHKWAHQSREPALEYLHCEVGYNYRMSNVLAGIGRGQLRVLSSRVTARRRVFDRYREQFAHITDLEPQPEAPWGTHSRWLSVFIVRTPGRHTVTGLIQMLADEGIEARPVWRPMHTQPLLIGAQVVGGSVAEELYQRGICLPSSSSLDEASQDRVITVVHNYFQS